MRRLATLLVVAVAAVGCTKGGEAGPQGIPGVLQTLVPPAANTQAAAPLASPYMCKTAPFVAGSNQVAVVQTTVTCSSVPSGSGIAPKVAWNDGTDHILATNWFLYNTNGGANPAYMASSNAGTITLTPGSTYAFEAYVAFYPSPPTGGACYCTLVAQIVGS